jgi:hypothetical protein
MLDRVASVAGAFETPPVYIHNFVTGLGTVRAMTRPPFPLPPNLLMSTNVERVRESAMEFRDVGRLVKRWTKSQL